MPTPILSRAVQVAIETESTTGTAETLVAADVTHRVMNPTFTYDFESEPQDLLSADLSELPDLIGNRPCEVTYETLLAGSGTVDTAAGFGAILIHAGMLETVNASTSVAYTPETPVTTSSATVGLWRGATSGSSGRLLVAKGCRVSSLAITLESGKPIKMAVTWRGAFSSDADASAFSSVTYDATVPPVCLSMGMSIGSWTPLLKSMTINLDNTLAPVHNMAATEASGISRFEISRRQWSGDIQFTSVLRSDKDALADILAQTLAATTLTVGPTGGNKVKFDFPKLQLMPKSESNVDDLLTETIPWKATRSTGDDEAVITTL